MRLRVIRMGCQLKDIPCSVLVKLTPPLKTAVQTMVVMTRVTPISCRMWCQEILDLFCVDTHRYQQIGAQQKRSVMDTEIHLVLIEGPPEWGALFSFRA